MTVLDRALRLHEMGFSLIPLRPMTKKPDGSVLPTDSDGEPIWKPYQTKRATLDELKHWFGNGSKRNIGIVLGSVSGNVAVVESDSSEAETWCAIHLPPTPMMTRSARGFHRYLIYVGDIPATIETDTGLKIEVKRDGQYVVAPGSIHPGDKKLGIPPGTVYEEVSPWPTDIGVLPLFPPERATAIRRAHTSKPLPPVIGEFRNSTLFSEAGRLRRLGWARMKSVRLWPLSTKSGTPPSRMMAAIAHSIMRYASKRMRSRDGSR